MAAGVPTSPAPPDVVQTTLARLHTWIDEVPPPQRRLGKFIVAAAALHVAAFFFILIDNTRPELRHQRALQVTLDNTAAITPEAAGNAYWDRLTDPRLYLLPTPAESAPGAAVAPWPVDFPPVALPAPAETGRFLLLNQPLPSLAERAHAALRPARPAFRYEEKPAPIARATTWQWEEPLSGRGPANVPSLPSLVSDTEIAPTRLRVAVAPDGTVSDVLLEESSQKPDLDQEAILAAQKVRFQVSGAPGPAWGLVTISWYYTPKPREAAPPSAPLAP